MRESSKYLQDVRVHFQSFLLLQKLWERLHCRREFLRRFISPPTRSAESVAAQASRCRIGVYSRCRGPFSDIFFLKYIQT